MMSNLLTVAAFGADLPTRMIGMHKHFRIMAIAQQLQNLAPETYTRIPGIWKKLSSLYNLEAIDERVGVDTRKADGWADEWAGKLVSRSGRGS